MDIFVKPGSLEAGKGRGLKCGLYVLWLDLIDYHINHHTPHMALMTSPLVKSRT